MAAGATVSDAFLALLLGLIAKLSKPIVCYFSSELSCLNHFTDYSHIQFPPV